MHLLRPYNKITLAGVALALLCIALPGQTDPVQAGQTGLAGAAAPPDPSKLEVSYANQKFSIEADHADVQSALKSIFSRAKLQFALKSNVTGQLTLRLTDQPVEVTLKTICKQTFLRYEHDAATDIYIFEQDTDAIKEAFTHLRSLNAQMRQQLRDQGLEVPDETLFAPGSAGANGPAGPAGPAGLTGRQNPGANTNGAARNGSTRQAGPPATSGRNQKIDTTLPSGDILNFLDPSSQGAMKEGDQQAYMQFLRQNNLVTINTQGKEVPVTDVFAELQRQSNVALLVDPDIPRGTKFRMQLTLRPTSLMDALNLLCPYLHLNWRRINNAIFLTPTSDFQIFWGNSNQPRIIYGPYQQSQQSQRGGYQNQGQGGFSGGGGQNNNPGNSGGRVPK